MYFVFQQHLLMTSRFATSQIVTESGGHCSERAKEDEGHIHPWSPIEARRWLVIEFLSFFAKLDVFFRKSGRLHCTWLNDTQFRLNNLRQVMDLDVVFCWLPRPRRVTTVFLWPFRTNSEVVQTISRNVTIWCEHSTFDDKTRNQQRMDGD